eukprot:m.33828 g.33828  ORF g.33828 m.33828 type:complete len:354 (+) comp31910_c0_seq1:30-1091(+)
MSNSSLLKTPRSLITKFVETAVTEKKKVANRPSPAVRRKRPSLIPPSLRKRAKIVEETPRTTINHFLATERTVFKDAVETKTAVAISPESPIKLPTLSILKTNRKQTSRGRNRPLTVTFRDEKLPGIPLIDFSSSSLASETTLEDIAQTVLQGDVSRPDIDIDQFEPEPLVVEHDDYADPQLDDQYEPEPLVAERDDYVDPQFDDDEEDDDDHPEEEEDKENHGGNSIIAEEVEKPTQTRKRVQRKRAVPRLSCKWLKRGFIKRKFQHHGECRLSPAGLDYVVSALNKFYEQLFRDLDAYAAHAGRKTIRGEDVELHLKRVKIVNDRQSLESLIYDLLPMEAWKVLMPIPRAL